MDSNDTNPNTVIDDSSQFMEILARSVAHELRTPLAIININLGLLELNQTAILAEVKKNLDTKLLKEPLDYIKSAMKLITHAVDNIGITLKTVVAGKIDRKELRKTSIANIITAALANYPFINNEKKLISWDKKNDFHYLGDDLLTQHVIFNLIKNALRAIKEAGKGKVTIDIKKKKDCNEVRFIDTAKAIAPEDAAKLFERFTEKKPATIGAGLGLLFCKIVMQAYGGDIVCCSKEGKHTEFVLTFPINV